MLLALALLCFVAYPVLAVGENREQRAFIDWLEDFLESPPDTKPSEMDSSAMQTYQSREDTEYCSKYLRNHRRYCEEAAEVDMQGVLKHFCIVYGSRCFASKPMMIIPQRAKASRRPAGQPMTAKEFLLSRAETLEYCRRYREHSVFFCRASDTKDVYGAFCHSYSRNCGGY